MIVPGLASLSLLLAATSAEAGVPLPDVVEGTIVLQSGDTPTGGAAVVEMRSPWVNEAGEVAFVGTLDDGDHYVFVGNAVVWLGSDDAMATLDGLESPMDSNGLGNFVYAIDVDGLDGLYTDAGVFAMTGDAAPGFPMAAAYTFLSSPQMTADGAIYFIGIVDTTGDGVTDGRGFFRSPDGTPGSTELLLAFGDDIGGFTIDDNNFGIDFSYAVSEDGMHRIHILNTEGATATDAFIWVDDMLVARELDPTGDGDNWDNFDLVGINTGGNYVFAGDTDGAGGADRFVAYNGVIGVREGDTVDGVDINPGSDLRFLALSDLDQATHAWARPTAQGFRETVFFACDAADIGGSSIEVLTTVTTELDVDGDGAGDYTITDITMNQPTDSKAIGETQFVYMEVELDDGMEVTQAMIEVPVSCCGNGAVNPFEDCDDGNDDDTDDCTSECLAASCGDGFLQDGVEDCDDGNDDDTDDCTSECLAASCGDGFVQDGAEDCDDGNDDDTDECTSTCEEASCGDGFVQDGVEDCDDGNDDDGDDCRNDCTLPGGVDDTAGDTGEDDTGGTGGTGGNSGPGPSTLSAGDNSAGDSGTDGDTDGDSDSDSSGQTIDDDGCGCQAGERRLPGVLWSLIGFGLLGLGRRRRG